MSVKNVQGHHVELKMWELNFKKKKSKTINTVTVYG